MSTPAGTLVLPASASRKRWLAERKYGLGASDTAAILGLSPWRTPLDVYLDKMQPSDDSAGEAAEWGLLLESAIARRVNTLYRHKIGRIAPTPGLLRHDQHPWMLATIDRLLYVDERCVGVLEVKTAGHFQRDAWRDGVPLYYQVQVQQQLAVSGLGHGYVAVLHGGQHMPEPYRVDRDDNVIAQLIEYGGRWWREHVLALVPPEPTIADDAALSRAFPGEPGTRVDLAEEGQRLWLLSKNLRGRISSLKAKQNIVDNRLRYLMGDATEAFYDDHLIATWRPYVRRSVDLEAMRNDHPDLVEQYTKTTPYRRLDLKEQS